MWVAALGATAFVLAFLLSVALEYDEEAHKHSHKIDEQLQSMRHKVPDHTSRYFYILKCILHIFTNMCT